MTEKLARRGVRVPAEYAADFLDQIGVADACTRDVVMLQAGETLVDVQLELANHQGFPVVDEHNNVVGVITRRDYLGKPPETRIGDLVRRPPAVVFLDSSLRDAADHMVREGVGRMPVVSREDPRKVVGIITRSDLLEAHARRLREESA